MRFEPRGPILLTLALVALLVGLTEGAHWGWTAPKTGVVFAGASLLAAAWLRNELRVADPMMDVRMFVHRDVALTCATAAFAGVALFATFLAIPIFIETPNALPPELASLVSYGFGASPTRTGLYLMPAAIAGLLAGAIASRIERRYGTKRALIIAMMLELLGAVSLALWHDRPWHVALGVILLFAGFPAVGAVTTTLVVRTVRATEVGVASSMVQVFRAIGGVIGGQAGAAVLTSHTIHGTDVPTETAFVFAFLITAVVAALAVLFASFITVAGPGRTDDDAAIVQASLAQTLE